MQRSYHTSPSLNEVGFNSLNLLLLWLLVQYYQLCVVQVLYRYLNEASLFNGNPVPLPILSTFEDKTGLRLYLSNPQQLSGEQLSKSLYVSLSNFPKFKDFAENKFLIVSVSTLWVLNPEILMKGE